MNESPRATRAYLDYQALGSGRTLAALAAQYRERRQTEGKAAAPTVNLRRLELWSSTFAWQARLAGELAAEREQNEAHAREARARILSEGLATDYGRVEALKEIAAAEIQIVSQCLEAMKSEQDSRNRVIAERYRIFKASLDSTLSQLAAETGGRVKRVNVVRELSDYAAAYARQMGFNPDVAISIAKMIANEGQS